MEKNSCLHSTGWLLVCGAIAAGEFAASRVPQAAFAWPAFAGATVIVALLGYGLAVRGWLLFALFLAGAALFFHSSVADEEMYRLKPWMREVAQRRGFRGQTCRYAAEIRRDLSRRAGIGLEGADEAAALNRAILLGERAGISPASKKAFLESGAIHVFAISGLHVMAIARTLAFCLRIVFVPRMFAGAATIPLVWLYIWMIGAPPSAVRAGAMASICCAAPVFGRRPDGIMAWAVTFLMVYLTDPRMISNMGCGLSFIVMLAILWVVRDGASGGWRVAFKVAVAAWVVGAPVTAYAFGRFTPGGMIASLVLIPAATVSVSVGVVGLAASFASMALTVHLNRLSALCTEVMASLADILSHLPLSSFETGRWTLMMCVMWYAAVAGALWLRASVRRRRSSRIL